MDTRRPVLTAERLGVARGKRRLFDAVDLTLYRGETVALLGPNGVGKSTLLSVLAGLLPRAGGRVRLDGRVAAALQSPVLAQRSVLANLYAAMSWWGVPGAERAGRARAALAALNVEHLADRAGDTLSGGEARRVHFARALSLRSDALLLDEPFAGLDPPTRAGLLGEASVAFRDPDRATMIVVHDRAEAWALADRLIVLLESGVAAEGSPQDVLEHPRRLDVAQFLGFTGLLREPDGSLRCVRPANVSIDPSGEFHGVVARRVPEEDGVLCEVTLPAGEVQFRCEYPGPTVGSRLDLRIDGGAGFREGG